MRGSPVFLEGENPYMAVDVEKPKIIEISEYLVVNRLCGSWR